MDEDAAYIIKLGAIGISVVVFAIALFWSISATSRVYDVWAESKVGQAELARAESNRQIKTLEAKAELESSKYKAEAEIVRSRGVAEANNIIGSSLKGNEGYLRYLWIQSLDHGQHTVIYVPTEANLPLLEASRLK